MRLQSLSGAAKPRLLHSVRNDKPACVHPHVDRRGTLLAMTWFSEYLYGPTSKNQQMDAVPIYLFIQCSLFKYRQCEEKAKEWGIDEGKG